MSNLNEPFRRPYAAELARRLAEPRRFIQMVTGGRQVGKTTLVQQVVEATGLPVRFASADEPTLRGTEWIGEQWEAARLAAGPEGGLLVIDEVQKAMGWAESIKRLWDEDTRTRHTLKVVLLGSAPLLIQRGLSESLAGRFEVLHLPHWSFAEMRTAFGFSIDQFTDGSSNRLWALIWPTPRPAALATSSIGAKTTAKWTSWCARATAWSPSR